MKTAEKTQSAEQGATSKTGNALKTENRPNLTGKEAKQNEPAKNQSFAKTSEVKATQPGEIKAGVTATMDNQPAHVEAGAVKPGVTAEEPNKEVNAEVRYIMPPRNVEATLKEVENLHRKGVQRMNLITRKKQLDTFEVALAQEADELNDNPFQGCKLIIRDDRNREFVTTTPGLIRLVAQFIYEACDNKLAEIEATIIFPNA